jgi:hypothetical protein
MRACVMNFIVRARADRAVALAAVGTLNKYVVVEDGTVRQGRAAPPRRPSAAALSRLAYMACTMYGFIYMCMHITLCVDPRPARGPDRRRRADS